MDDELKNKIIDFYDSTYWNYRIGWGISRHYGIHYGFYDEKHRNHNEAVLNMNRVTADIVGVNSQSKILDAGCGIGGSAIWLAKNFGAKVTGITISKKQCAFAKKIAEKERVSQLTQFYVRDFLDTGFPDESFDIVWAIESVCYAENKRDFLAEAKRILKIGGRLIVADGFLRNLELSPFDRETARIWFQSWAVPNLATPSEFKNYLEKLEFKNIQFVDITKNILPSAKRIYLMGLLGYPIGEFLRKIHLLSKKNKSFNIGTILQYRLLQGGVWLYGIFSAEK